MKIETRYTPSPAGQMQRLAPLVATGKTTLVHGYGSVFYRAGDASTEYRLGRGVVERIAPTAFDRALRENQDVLALFNHDPNMLLARRSSGTLSLVVDKIGLRYSFEPPDTSAGRDIKTMLRRRDLRGSSFSFTVRGEKWTDEGPLQVRTLTDLDLWDTGPVSAPAYVGSSAELFEPAPRFVPVRGSVLDLYGGRTTAKQAAIRARLVEIESSL